MEKVDLVLVGAHGVVESGGIINKLGTSTVAVVAAAMNKPFYVAVESHKFVRIFPISQVRRAHARFTLVRPMRFAAACSQSRRFIAHCPSNLPCNGLGDDDNRYIPVVMNYGDDFKYNLFCPSLSPPECLPACSKQCFVSLPPRQSRVWVYCILLELLCVW